MYIGAYTQYIQLFNTAAVFNPWFMHTHSTLKMYIRIYNIDVDDVYNIRIICTSVVLICVAYNNFFMADSHNILSKFSGSLIATMADS